MAMAARSQSPSHDGLPLPSDSVHLNRGYGPGSGSRPNSYIANSSDYGAAQGAVADPSPLAHSTRFSEEFETSQRGSSLLDIPAGGGLQRSESQMSHRSLAPSRLGTLKKKPSLSKKGSIKRSGSRRSLRAGSVRSLHLGEKEKYGGEDVNSAFYVPIPTSGSPTDELANRFQAWRKVLKDLIVFFKDIQKSYETRAKLLLSTSNIINNMTLPSTFLESGGLADATEILRSYHKQGLIEANRAREVESEVVMQLTGLRSDLQQKTKEIKSLSGDFKNSVDKEVENTRKAVRNLQETLGLVDIDPSATSGKHDPFILRLGVDRQIEKQIEEENYLHRAYLNLESSGRELESIVVGEIQKAYNAYANILKREADEAYDTVEKLRAGPISMPKDHEWNNFIAENDQLVDPRVPLRSVENITYPGKDHPAAAEVRSGMLERKSKYLKSYTPGWYVLSPTHLHEFKSADRIASQTPVMSLYLPEQKLGSHSQPDSTSHKFMLKGRQTGSMHRGHAWVFRAESYDTMMAWYDDIANLIGKTGEARNAFVKRHMRTLSGSSFKASSISSDGVMDEDEADRTPYSGNSAVLQRAPSVLAVTSAPRPQPGGRFPSDVQIDRHLHDPLSRSSGESAGGRDAALAAAAALPGSGSGVPPAVGHEVNDINQNARPYGASNDESKPERYDSYDGDWTSTSAGLTTQTVQHDAAIQPDRLVALPIRQAVASSSTENRGDATSTVGTDAESSSTAPPSMNTTEQSTTTTTGLTSISAGEEAALAGLNQGQLRRQESQRSKQSQSPFSLTGSRPSSIATSSPSTDGAAGATSNAARPGAQSKRSSLTIDLLKMPGKFPRTMTS
ncbi:hypothetical protein VTN77DRAFT_8832 [Rasamsonia byssochlamydoides]|uniref:uncharacterized protein n=1 Tax=Rasamsonia byssochlamydoides TaxID=89139 RepID=UPI0037443706